jgi:polysaccharide biosynthesis/export protein ExoF
MRSKGLGIIRALGVLAVTASCGGTQFAHAGDYLLNSYDRVRVMIVEWDLEDLRSPINGEFTVDADGNITLPLLGQIETAGNSSATVAGAIADKLRQKLDLQSPPIATVEIVSYRPVYVLGDVRASGQIAFTPGMTVLQALALAGGLVSDNVSESEVRRQALVARDDLAAMKAEREMLRAKDARLSAEFRSLEKPAFQAASAKDGEAGSLVVDWENSIFSTRREFAAAASGTYGEIKRLAAEEVAILEEHAAAVRRQQEAVASQLAVVSTLRDRGLGSSARETELERALTDLESKEQEVLGRIVKVKQDMVRLDEQRAGAENQRRIEIASDFQATRKTLNELEARIATAERLMAMSEPLAEGGPFFVVSRAGSDGAQVTVLESDEWSVLQSGDILQVFRNRLPDRVIARLSEPALDAADEAGQSVAETRAADEPIVSQE